MTVIHFDVTSYFTTTAEACELVVQAGATNETRQVIILDIAVPVHIFDVTRRIIEIFGKGVEIVFAGLRHGANLHKTLFSADEQVSSPNRTRISHTPVEAQSPMDIAFTEWATAANVKTTPTSRERNSWSYRDQDPRYGDRNGGQQNILRNSKHKGDCEIQGM